jgi:GLPGLI family protein
MIKFLTTFSFLFTLGFSVFAQQKEGTIDYVIDVQAIDTSLKVRQQVGLLRNSGMKVCFMKDKSRLDFKMGEMYDISVVVDWKINRSLSLFATPKGKFATKMEAEQYKASQPQEDTTIVLEVTDEKKKILNYNCTKAILHSKDADFVYWYTTEIQIDLKGQSIVNKLIPGFPLEFQTIKDGILMNFKVSNLKFKVENKSTVFSTVIPQGYTVIQDIQ